MKILTFLNVSNRSRLHADSGYIFYNLLSPYFTMNNEFFIASPEPLSDEKCSYIPKEFGFNKYEVRFSFDWENVSRIIKEIKPDILLINQVEQVPHYKAVIQALGINVLIACYAHYIPYIEGTNGLDYDESLNNGGLGFSICMSFLSGLYSSDLVFTHSNTSKELLKKLLYKYNINYDDSKIIINPPPFDPYMKSDNNNPQNRIIYNHRLYRHYGTEFFCEFARKLVTEFDVEINVLDVLGERTQIQQRMDSSVDEARKLLSSIPNLKIINDTFVRNRYYEVLKGAIFSIAPYRPNCIWAMSCIDSLGMGVPVIAPNIAWFKEFIPHDLRFDSESEAMLIARHLIEDKEYWFKKSKQAHDLIADLSPATIAKRFLYCFNNINTA